MDGYYPTPLNLKMDKTVDTSTIQLNSCENLHNIFCVAPRVTVILQLKAFINATILIVFVIAVTTIVHVFIIKLQANGPNLFLRTNDHLTLIRKQTKSLYPPPIHTHNGWK